jgi:hypothetical protein
MNIDKKLLLWSAGIFVVITAANVTAEALYRRVKIGTDTKVLIGGIIVGVTSTYFMLKFRPT